MKKNNLRLYRSLQAVNIIFVTVSLTIIYLLQNSLTKILEISQSIFIIFGVALTLMLVFFLKRWLESLIEKSRFIRKLFVKGFDIEGLWVVKETLPTGKERYSCIRIEYRETTWHFSGTAYDENFFKIVDFASTISTYEGNILLFRYGRYANSSGEEIETSGYGFHTYLNHTDHNPYFRKGKRINKLDGNVINSRSYKVLDKKIERKIYKLYFEHSGEIVSKYFEKCERKNVC